MRGEAIGYLHGKGEGEERGMQSKDTYGSRVKST
jgi:hypothetical protein